MKFYNIDRELVEKPEERSVKKRLSVHGICIREQKVLLVQPVWSPKWETPGGQVEPNESEIEALVREFREETGYCLPEQDFTFFAENRENFYNDGSDTFYDSTIKYYFVQDSGKQDEALIDREEIVQVKWHTRGTLFEANVHPICWKILQKVFQMNNPN